MIDFPDEQVAVAGLKGPVRLADVLFLAQKSNRIAPLQVVRADAVVGTDHVRSAALHARRAESEGRMQAKTLDVEFARYLSGERQIRAALDRVGVADGTEAVAAVALGPKRRDALQHFLHAIALPQDDGLLAAAEWKLLTLGVSAQAISATEPSRRMDLALQAVAAVDLARP